MLTFRLGSRPYWEASGHLLQVLIVIRSSATGKFSSTSLAAAHAPSLENVSRNMFVPFQDEKADLLRQVQSEKGSKGNFCLVKETKIFHAVPSLRKICVTSTFRPL